MRNNVDPNSKPSANTMPEKLASFSPEYKAIICAVNVVHGSQGVVYNPEKNLTIIIFDRYPVPTRIWIFSKIAVPDPSSHGSHFFSSSTGSRYHTGTLPVRFTSCFNL
jgi:hypothetical protein